MNRLSLKCSSLPKIFNRIWLSMWVAITIEKIPVAWATPVAPQVRGVGWDSWNADFLAPAAPLLAAALL